MTKPKLDSPNYTQIPNDLLGHIAPGNRAIAGIMANLEGSQLKVFLAVCRLTFGYHQSERRASLAMMMTLTGLSKPGVHHAATRLEELGLIERSQDGGVTLWKVAVNSVNQGVVNSVNRMVNSVNQDGKLSLPPSKKETRKKPENKFYYSDSDLSEICELYETHFGSISPMRADEIKDVLSTYPIKDIKWAISRAVKVGKRSWGYAEGILKNHEEERNGQKRTHQGKRRASGPAQAGGAGRTYADRPSGISLGNPQRDDDI